MKRSNPYLDFLQRKVVEKIRRDPRDREDYLLDRDKSVKWMLRGLVFVPITAVADHFYRLHRGTGTDTETMLMVFVIISIIGMMQFPIGFYYLIKNRNQDIEKGPK